MNVTNFVGALKEFFLDILGFFLPGFFLILLLNFFCNLKEFNIYDIDSSLEVFFLILSSYTLGYLVYSFSVIRDKLIKKTFLRKAFTIPKHIQDSIKKKEDYELALEKMKELYKNKTTFTKDANFNTLRSLAMSYIPEADEKIYKFMFRSELSNHLGIISFLIPLVTLLNYLLNLIFGLELLFKTNQIHIIYCLMLLAGSFFLRITRFRFLKVALSIPFSIFVAKFYRDDESRTT